MMHFRGFKTKAALKARVKAGKVETQGNATVDTRVHFERYAEETSMFGLEFKPGVARSYTVCLDPATRMKFANITVGADGFITKVA